MKSNETKTQNFVTVNNRVEWTPGIEIVGNWLGWSSSLITDEKTGIEKEVFFGSVFNETGVHKFSLGAGLKQMQKYPAGIPVQIRCIGSKQLGGGRTFNEFSIGVDSEWFPQLQDAMTSKERPEPLAIEGDPFAE